jgi:phospholipid/cholesterol/gamma-HCH transport system substrate-binding protein
VVDAVVAPAMGVPLDRVPDVASLLFGPLARGAEVSLR